MKKKDLLKIIPGPEPKIKVKIPVCEPSLEGNELKYVTECIKTNWISSKGDYIEKFEKMFSRCCGARYGIACTSGTTALHLALASLGIRKGDEVIIPTFTMIATANAITYTGAKMVLVDSEPKTWNIDPEKIREFLETKCITNEQTGQLANRLTGKLVKAIIPVHTYGHPANMDKTLALAKKYNLFVIEDACEAHGAEYKGRRIGSLGDVACFSFYANKIITTGEGGMLTTNNKEIAQKARTLRNYAFSQERHFWHKYLGFNYRITNLQAAIGLAQTERFDELVQARIENARYYNSLLKDVRGITRPPETEGIKNVFWMYSILVEDDFGMSRDKLRERLAQKGIETRSFFIPIHLQPLYSKLFKERFPVAEDLCRKGMYLPSAPTLKKKEIEFIAQSIKECSK